MTKKILALLLATLLFCGVLATGVSADDGYTPVQYICSTADANTTVITLKKNAVDENGDPISFTLLQPTDTVKFDKNGKATITYHADADSLYIDEATAASVVNGAFEFKNPALLAESGNKFKTFEHSYARAKLTGNTYTILGIGDVGAASGNNITWNAQDSEGTDLGSYAIDFALTENDEQVVFLGWAALDAKCASSASTLNLYAVWGKETVRCECGGICICDCGCTPEKCMCEYEEDAEGNHINDCGCRCDCAKEPVASVCKHGCTCDCGCTEEECKCSPTVNCGCDCECTIDPDDIVTRLVRYIDSVSGLIATVYTLLGTILGGLIDNVKLILYTWFGFFDILD